MSTLYRKIYERFCDAIAQGTLKPGDRVPSLRDLASQLNCARGTVEVAYELLISEGVLVSHGQAGTFVTPHLTQMAAQALQRRESLNKTLASPDLSRAQKRLLPLHPCVPSFDAFPQKIWARLGSRRLRKLKSHDLFYPDPEGWPPLRLALANYLQISRGVNCSPSQVFITQGYQGALELIAQTLLKKGETIWYEDPGYPAARRLLEAMGGRIQPVPVDEEGLMVSVGVKKAPCASLAVVTPSHQSPLGMSLSLSRRLAILEWAKRNQSWVIEDDYDGEFHYTGRALPALKSLDQQERVIYAGSFSKVLSPALRTGFLVVPKALVGQFEASCRTFSKGCPQLTQAMIADFMLEGHFLRHIRKMRNLYSVRRQYLIDGLYSVFKNKIKIDDELNGMHLIVRTRLGRSDKDLARLFTENGFGIQAISNWSLRSDCEQGILVGFTNILTAEMANRYARELRVLISSK